ARSLARTILVGTGRADGPTGDRRTPGPRPTGEDRPPQRRIVLLRRPAQPRGGGQRQRRPPYSRRRPAGVPVIPRHRRATARPPRRGPDDRGSAGRPDLSP